MEITTISLPKGVSKQLETIELYKRTSISRIAFKKALESLEGYFESLGHDMQWAKSGWIDFNKNPIIESLYYEVGWNKYHSEMYTYEDPGGYFQWETEYGDYDYHEDPAYSGVWCNVAIKNDLSICMDQNVNKNDILLAVLYQSRYYGFESYETIMLVYTD